MTSQHKRPQILQLHPAHEIVLQGPFDHVVTSYLELYNPSNQKVCFKVKTTAPRRYCVRPNSGIINPETKVKIAIMLQPIDNDTQSERNKHKFMVQSIVVDDDSINSDTVWSTADPGDIMDSKLRCVFQMASLSEASENPQNTVTTAASATPTTAASAPATTAAVATAATAATQTKITTPSAATPTATIPTTQTTPTVASPTKNTSISSLSTSVVAQPMNDNFKLVLLSLAMLFIGLLLGKYI